MRGNGGDEKLKIGKEKGKEMKTEMFGGLGRVKGKKKERD